MKTTRDDAENSYTCGQCGLDVYYLASKNPPKECPYCGWKHREKKKYDVPSEFKTKLNQF